MITVFNRHVWMIKGKKWCLYFPSTYFIGSYHMVGYFKNWSFCFLTLERKDR